MRTIAIHRDWLFAKGQFSLPEVLSGSGRYKTVQLPHDYMIEEDVHADAVPGPASGYYCTGVAHYTKMVMIPAEWEKEQVGLAFDGVMMNATIFINGCKAAFQHYGYAPFYVDITEYILFGRENRITVSVNPSMQPNSRWYSGAGLFRGISLVHKPMLAIRESGIYGVTERIEYGADGAPLRAFLRVRTEIENKTTQNKLAAVTIRLHREGRPEEAFSRSAKIMIPSRSEETAYIAMTVEHPDLWSAETPDLYTLEAEVKELGIFKTHEIRTENGSTDSDTVRFGIRTVTADAVNGLQVNGKSIKLAGGCLHHDNGILGAVSLYDSEERKLRRLKEIGFNAVRTTHNPPSSVFLEACDRLGLYVFDEACDAWDTEKQPGDYNMFFETDWKKDLTAFIRRDRSCPSVILWSTGNEIPERGGLNHGYTWAARLAAKIRELDPSRPVSNALCSMWSGLDHFLEEENMRKLRETQGIDAGQNADAGKEDDSWEFHTEAFTNGLDIVGYNYMEDKYEYDHAHYPDRVILGSENFGKDIGMHWPMILDRPYVIGDFTWTAYDYLGEAGIGKSAFYAPDDPHVQDSPYSMMTQTSYFPWRLANDADVDINGNLLPQGAYRSVVFGSAQTCLYSYRPEATGKVEKLSPWGFTDVQKSWTWPGQEGHSVSVLVFSRAEEVTLELNGKPVRTLKAGESERGGLPLSFLFELPYEPGELCAVSWTDGKEVSRDTLSTAGPVHGIRLSCDRTVLPADGMSAAYVEVELVDAAGNVVPNADVPLRASISGTGAYLAAFGSGNPVTDENYARGAFTSYRGRACAIIRSGYEAGQVCLTVESGGMKSEWEFTVS